MVNPELERLRAVGKKLAEATTQTWQPQCVVRALLAEPVKLGPWSLGPMTLRHWLLLDAMRSPMISGHWPEEGAERLGAVYGALNVLNPFVFTLDDLIEEVPADELADVIGLLGNMVKDATETAIAMHRPPQPGAKPLPPAPDSGFGLIMPMYAFLAARGYEHDTILDTPLVRLFALHAATLAREGFVPKGANYYQREAGAI